MRMFLSKAALIGVIGGILGNLTRPRSIIGDAFSFSLFAVAVLEDPVSLGEEMRLQALFSPMN